MSSSCLPSRFALREIGRMCWAQESIPLGLAPTPGPLFECFNRAYHQIHRAKRLFPDENGVTQRSADEAATKLFRGQAV